MASTYTGVIDAIQNSAGAPLTINPTGGYVGINTTTPTVPLDVQGGTRTYGIANFDGATYFAQDFKVAGVHKGYLASASAVISGGSANDVALDASAGNLILATGDQERARIDSSGYFKFDSGYGSVATAYGCRAWCQYNQSATIIGAGNVTSITVIGTGDVRLNFATALVDANFSAVATTNESGGQPKFCNSTQPSTTSIRIVTFNANGSTGWFEYNSVAVFR